MKWTFSELINVNALQAMAENLHVVSGIPVGIVDSEGKVLVSVGWQDICTKYHRIHPYTSKCCRISDNYIKKHIGEKDYVEYKCLNNLWDVAIPIVVSDEHIGTLFVGQFFYEDEVPDIEFFMKQADEFGFDKEEYISALDCIPIFSREKVKYIMKYYKGLVDTLIESSMAKLKCRNAEKNLRRNQARLSNILKSMREVILVWEEDEVVTECYKSSKNKFISIPGEIIGKKLQQNLPSKVAALYRNEMDRLKNNEIVESIDYEIKIGEETFWHSAQFSKVNGEGEEANKFMAVIRDITTKKMYEKELIKAKNEAETANEMKSIFIANMSHELRTPMNVLLSAIQLFELNMQNSLEVINCNKHLNSMKQNSYRLLRIINNIIDITKIESGFMDLHLKNINIVNLVEDITFSVAEYAKNKELYVQFDTEIEERIIALDPDKIERIMLNLLSNAIKCTKKNGSIFVNIYDKETSVLISVKDTGVGIPKDKINQIFERFIQVEDTLIKSHEGSGIGLSIVKSFVDMHGGNIATISEVDVGTEFLIEIPINTIDEQYEKENSINISNQNYVEMFNIEFSDIYL